MKVWRLLSYRPHSSRCLSSTRSYPNKAENVRPQIIEKGTRNENLSNCKLLDLYRFAIRQMDPFVDLHQET